MIQYPKQLTRILAFVALLALAPQAAAFKCLPIYGNWCGPGHPSSGPLPPVDAYDAVCMRHDLCSMAPGPDRHCDWAFVGELNSLAAHTGYLPRPLQWAEYLIRFKAGGSPMGFPMPTPFDAMGLASAIASPCW